MDERKCYSRDWRTRLPCVKLKTRAWITRNMPAGVSFKSLRLYRRKVGQGDLGRNNSEETYLRILRVWLVLMMETRSGTEESPRGLCEISSSTRLVNEAINRGRMMRRVKKGKKEGKSKPKDFGSAVRLE